MHFDREINRLLGAILASFALIAAAAAYWAVIGPDTVARREDNPRRIEAERAIVRGNILDRTGAALAQSTREPGLSSRIRREYPHPETSAVLGYASFRYGVGGVEAAYNDILRGDQRAGDPATQLINDLLHYPQYGDDLMLTLDLSVQQQIIEAMGDQKGAVVVLGVPNGDILALVSQPSFDPNTLDQEWERIAADPGNPFFNRVLQGRYQPGGTLQTILIATALLTGQPMEQIIEDATARVDVGGSQLGCAIPFPPGRALTLRESFIFACPASFVQLVNTLGPDAIQAAFDTFIPEDRATLPGFAAPPARPTLILTDRDSIMLEEALGQGTQTVSPLEMAMMAAAIINDGNAPQPRILLQTRAAKSDMWSPIADIRRTVPFSTVETARQLQDLLREAANNGAAVNAARLSIDIGGHAALAYSGDQSLAWFVGFATVIGNRAIAIAVILEDSDDPGLAADIGGTALAAAHAALRSEAP